ncbi:hypothetical protein QEG73_03385 [Chitinophagaceae bacterium 26-R-25]|nr:hypothetical protein [Chitinophagaceae bacterium 26-R-25]
MKELYAFASSPKCCQLKTIIIKKKGVVLLFFFVLVGASVFAQSASKRGYVGVSVPVIVNNSEALYYQLGSPKHPTGTAVSYGVNINYTQPFLKNFYARASIGYFRQAFNLLRPFQYHTPDGTKPLYHTKKYFYDNLISGIAIGYKRTLDKQYSINADVCYNHLSSFRQKYIATENQAYQVNKESFSPGHFISLNIGSERVLNEKFSIGFNVCVPVYTKWNNDEMFYKFEYSDKSQQIAKTKFSLGMGLSCFFHL